MAIHELESRVKSLLLERLGLRVREIGISARLRDDLGMDSLDGVQLMIAAEHEFGVLLSDDQIGALQTVADLVALIDKLGSASEETGHDAALPPAATTVPGSGK